MKPTFLVIGAQKSGTTWLQKNLSEHPEIFSPRHKELHYFDKDENYSKGADWYRSQFAGAVNEKASGEYTPNYLWCPTDPVERAEGDHFPDIAARAHAFDADLRWIAVLRDPVERAISAYYHHIRAGRVAPNQKISQVWNRFGIISMGEYARSLRPWLELFPPEQGKVLVFEEDILQRPEKTLRDIYTFLGVDPEFLPPRLTRTHNPCNSHFLLHLNHRVPSLARFLQKFWPEVGQRWTRFNIPVGAEERNQLREHYAESIAELEQLLQRDLPWKQKKEDKKEISRLNHADKR